MSAWRRYTRSFVVESMCCPSRASTLTGRIPTHTGVDTLVTGAKLDERKTFATMLHHYGYATTFAGKYLNGYPFARGPYTPPGWDRFFAGCDVLLAPAMPMCAWPGLSSVSRGEVSVRP